MTLLAIKKKFLNGLASSYPAQEINSIFKLLVYYKLNIDAATIILDQDKELEQENTVFFQNALQRLIKKEPVQYIIGETSFFDLTFIVTPDVLIPRPETEELVQWIISDTQTSYKPTKVKILDIGTGSGCIAISLAKNIPNTEIWALDVSQAAIEVAKKNAKQNEAPIHFLKLDILTIKKLPHFFDIIVSNPPYVKQQEKQDMHDNVLQYEPEKALYVSDENPLIFYDKIADLAKNHLTKNGKLYFEINQYLGKETHKLIQSIGFKNILLKKDFLGNDRMIRAEKLTAVK